MKARHFWPYAVALAGALGGFSSELRADEQPIGILLSAGDIATCDKNSVRNGMATAELVDQEIKRANATFPGVEIAVLALGDVSYPIKLTNGSLKSSIDCFDESWGRRFKDKILPVPGNHDLEVSAGLPYFEYFASTLKKLEGVDGTYALDFPYTGDKRWRLIGLNPYKRSKIGRKEWMVWLQGELEGAKAAEKCVLVFAHPFFYSSGYHGHNDGGPGQPLAPLKFMKEIFTALYREKASVLLAGHDHHFEQLGRAGPNAEAKDLGKSAMVDDGVRSFVVGTGGKALYSKNYKQRWAFSEAYSDKSFGVLKIELYPSSYKWAFIPTTSSLSSMQVNKQVSADQCNLAK